MKIYIKNILITFIIICAMGLTSFAPDARASTVLNQADMVRFMYWLINGPPGGSYPVGYDGPNGGFLGMIRDITGPTSLGRGLSSSGYSECGDIPSIGSASMEDNGTFNMVFGTPAKTIPTGWTGAGTSYEKRVTVAFNGTTFMDIEFNCSRVTGWMRFFEPGSAQATARNIEIYYDTTDSAAAKMELYMYYVPDASNSEYFMSKFETLADNKYRIWITRSAQEFGTWNGFRVAIHGSTSLAAGGLANAFMLMENGSIVDTTVAVTDNTGDILTGDKDCIDFNNGGPPQDGGGACSTNSLTPAEGGAPIIDATGDFSINWVGTSLAGQMTSLP